jgi:hypothetical protein
MLSSSRRRATYQTLLIMTFLSFLGPANLLRGQTFKANYDESMVPKFTLPPLLKGVGSEEITADRWPKQRENLYALCRDHIYGQWDCPGYELAAEIVEQGEYLDGKAIRTQWKVTISSEHGSQSIDLLVYLPSHASNKSKVPLFLGLNFAGNHVVANDAAIRIPTSWMRADGDRVEDNRATEKGRGIQDRRWPIDEIIPQGFGLATAYYGDLAPDDPAHYMEGIPRLNPKLKKDLGPFSLDATYQETEQPTTGGAIAVWSWGLSRLLDVLEKDPRIDSHKVIVIGHSRLGKTALWAGASDPRFAMVVSNNSGCGGAALSRRAFGETVQRINSAFPHWFCDQYRKYNKAEDKCPVDQHSLLALIAPRPLYVTSASEDLWADPRGEFLAAQTAGEVYRLLNETSLPDLEFPGFENLGDGKVVYGATIGDGVNSDVPTYARVGYHIRKGPHDILSWDWLRLMQFAKQNLDIR